MVDDRNRQGMTYFEVMANLQALQDTDQRVLLRKERMVNVGENEGQLMVPMSMETYTEGVHGGLLNSAEIKELDKLIRLVECGFEAAPGCFVVISVGWEWMSL